jgi:hypothetical protein
VDEEDQALAVVIEPGEVCAAMALTRSDVLDRAGAPAAASSSWRAPQRTLRRRVLSESR